MPCTRHAWRSLFLVVSGVLLTLVLEHGVFKQSPTSHTCTHIASPFTVSPATARTARSSNVGYQDQPLIHENGVKVVHFNGSKMNILHDMCTWKAPLRCQTLHTPAGDTPIYIHDIRDDKWISANVRNYGRWEYRNVQIVTSLLMEDPDLGFLDVGAHIGVFSLSVAKMGRKVVSVDPLIQNVKRLCKSAQMGDQSARITIVFNPVSDKQEHVSLRTDPGNISGTKVIHTNLTSSTDGNSSRADKYYSITLDDLLPIVPFTKAVMKMDVQNHEYLVIKGGTNFFKFVDVPAILMEWELIKDNIHGPSLVSLLTGYNYSAYSPYNMGTRLSLDTFRDWPVDIVWIKDR